MDAVSIGIFLGAWFAVGTVVLALFALAGRAQRSDRRLRSAEARSVPTAFSGRQVRVSARRAQAQRAAADQRLRTGIRTAIH